MTPEKLDNLIPQSALAFRGYNQSNLGRTGELLGHARYGAIVTAELNAASEMFRSCTGRSIDLVSRVERGQDTDLNCYDEALALILAVEQAQLRCLAECFGIDGRRARLTTGYSLGEIGALVYSETLNLQDALRILLALTDDCVQLAHDVTLGVLFTRERSLELRAVHKTCLLVNQAGAGTVGVSAILSPNSVLLMGQGTALKRFKALAADHLSGRFYLRLDKNKWPPLHTPIVWQKAVPNRAAVLMQTLQSASQAPKPPVLSMVTGSCSYDDVNARELLHQWVDHPQRLWDVVYFMLSSGVETVVHVGPAPNIIPATLKRLKDNVESESRGRLDKRVLAHVVHRPWLQAMLPQRAPLLRAPLIRQIVLEDWLLEQE